MSKSYMYRGYAVTFNRTRPVTGQWRAERFGVGMCAGSEDALRRMVDQKLADHPTMKPAYWRDLASNERAFAEADRKSRATYESIAIHLRNADEYDRKADALEAQQTNAA